MGTIKPWHSKRNVFSAVSVVVVFYPPAAKFVSENPVLVMVAYSVVNTILSFFSKGKVSLN